MELRPLQVLLELYADESGLPVVLTDGLGSWLTRPPERLIPPGVAGKEVQARLEERVGQTIVDYAGRGEGVVCEVTPGIRLALVPVRSGGGRDSYIWAGPFADEREAVGSSAEATADGQSFPDWSFWPESLHGNTADAALVLVRLVRLAAVVESLLAQERAEESTRRRTELLRQLWTDGELPSAAWDTALAAASSEMDFIGFAVKTDGRRFVLCDYAGPGEAAVRGLAFSLGEGYIGQVATSRQAAFWEDVSHDPRTFVFAGRGLQPRAVFCVPVFRDQTLAGVLFGGSVSERRLGKDTLSFAQALADGRTAGLTLATVRADRDMAFTRLTTFVETCGTIYHAQDAKRLAYILVDMSLNLVAGPFSCVVLKPSDQKVQLVSRGLSRQQTESYVRDVAARWSKRARKQIAPEAEWCEMPDMSAVLECPLYDRNELLGVWCIGLQDPDQYAQYREYMTIVAQAAASVLYRLWEKGKIGRGDAVQLLNRALSYWDAKVSEKTHEARELALPLARSLQLGDEEVRLIGEACLIYPYPTSFLEEVLQAPDLHRVISDFENIVHNQENSTIPTSDREGKGSTGGQLLALIYVYLQSNRDLAAVHQLKAVGSGVKEAFLQFCASMEMVEGELLLGADEPAAAREESVADGPPDISQLDLPTLSAREQEVLAQVLQGKSNREIAEELVISEHTVKNHMTHIFHKLGVTDRTQAIALVYKASWRS